MNRLNSEDPRIGYYVGSGTGGAMGPVLTGNVEWDLLGALGTTLCAANFRGKIRTDVDLVVSFECLAFFHRSTGPRKICTMSGTVIFETRDARFGRLTERPALWEGEFDMNSYTRRYLIYRQSDKPENTRC